MIIWIYEMLPAVHSCRYILRKNRDMPRMKQWSDTKKIEIDGQRPRNKMSPSDDEMTYSYYMSLQEYVYGERKLVSSPVRDHFRRQDESSSSGRSHGRGGRSGKPNLKEVLKRLHALEQHVFVEEVNNEDLWNNISFEEPVVFQTNLGQPVVEDEGMNKNNTNENAFGDIEDDKELEERNENAGCSRNKFDDDVFDLNDDNEAKEVSEEDHLIIMGNVNYYDDYGFDDKEVTPDRPRAQNPSKYMCTPYTELHTTPKQKRRPKKKVDIKSTSPVPPPTFVVVHDFTVLRLQSYVVAGESFLERLVWAYTRRVVGGSAYDHLERLFCFDSDRHTIMSPNFFVCHVLEDGYDWREFMSGFATYPNSMVARWDVDTVLMPIHSFPNHWLFGELRLASMEVHFYDSLGRGTYEKFNSDGTFTKF
uniref:Ubiquitin-like protease family profile domain-containing protein n=1 Tax=Lactuca sativa TaxID=4236 RepID=A0A9R1XV25_LACSA|nr:hypothetical protein LSAT_V11C100022200 [Lactuca sativa]